MTIFPHRTGTRSWKALALAAPLALGLALSACSSSSSSSSSSQATTSSTTTTTIAGTVTPTTAAGGLVATGTVTCSNVSGTITFNPPLSNSGTSPETTTISLNASGCTQTGSNAQVTSGTATATIPGSTNACTSLLTSKPVAVGVAWTPSSVHATVATFSGYAVVMNSAGDIGFGLPASGGTASVAGSFAGSDNGSASKATTYSALTSTQLLAECGAATGMSTLAITSGTATFG